jgi:hypothetical protein
MNAVDWGQSRRAFASSIFSLLERVEYRRITDAEDFNDVALLREQAYNSRTFIESDKFGPLVDEYDRMKDCYVIGVYLDEKLTSTVRIHVVSEDHIHGPVASYFPHRARELVEGGKRYIDPSRFAADGQALWDYPLLPFITLRAVSMAHMYFEAANIAQVVRADSASFYKRSFGSVEVEPAQMIDHFKVPLVMLVATDEEARHRLDTRYRFFKSMPSEQRMMFASEAELGFTPLNIIPTARFVGGNAELFQG